ncbi:class D beta-lactamase [Leptolyngbya sp. FACHB-60]|uniref:class D beta-lactamase n=1 Tax=Cyanophyceae TaxID=3028117 RepID=UPI001686CF7B|nr:class D beta-lactamase [Phormidium sp. FACHB-77]MBD2030354.1 class D beta-lactamase [Phormidium sp. FACHB-322]MBD2053356.1 class D beta-lactamase [Leptolyngbya sp. FACHB-60]
MPMPPAAAQSSVEPIAPTPSQQTASLEAQFAQHFQALGVEGAIIIHDVNQNVTYEHNRDRNRQAFLPASTFKILNSLIALETGVIANDVAVLTWDGIERMIPTWNQDLNLRRAFNLSAVWFYQVLARRVGHDRMQQWVSEAGYGNQAIGSPEAIDSFWLEGDLRITPQQQIEFLQRLHRNELPFSEETVATVKDIMIAERTPDYTLRAKTGWAGLGEADQPQIGWYVGYLERGENVYLFATNIDMRSDADLSVRLELTRRCFETLNLL